MAHNFDLLKAVTKAVTNHLINEHFTFESSMCAAQSNFQFQQIRIAVCSLDEGHLEIQAVFYRRDAMKVYSEADIPELLNWIFGTSVIEISAMCDICGNTNCDTQDALIERGWSFGGGAEFCPNHI